jgi:hypothetical protein
MLPATFDNLYKIFLAMDSINPSDRTVKNLPFCQILTKRNIIHNSPFPVKTPLKRRKMVIRITGQ